MITHISEKESQVTHMLTVCNEALREVTKERDALKAEIARLNSGWYDKLLEATLERDAQRKVLAMALEALQYCVQEAGPCEHECGFCVCKETDAITAIQGVLK